MADAARAGQPEPAAAREGGRSAARPDRSIRPDPVSGRRVPGRRVRRRRPAPGAHPDRPRDRRAQPRCRDARPRRALHPRRRRRPAPGCRDRGVRRRHRAGRCARRRLLPRRHRAATGAAARAHRGPGRRHRPRSSCSSTTCSSPGERSARRSTRSPSWAGPTAVQLAVLVDRGHRELPIRAGLRRQEPADEARRGRAGPDGRGRRRRGRRRAVGPEWGAGRDACAPATEEGEAER